MSLVIVDKPYRLLHTESMKSVKTAQTIATLSNGIAVRGSYQMSVNGAHFDLYVTNSDGLVISSRNMGIVGCTDPQADLVALVDGLTALLTRYKIHLLSEPRIINAAVPVIVKAFRKDIALSQAA